MISRDKISVVIWLTIRHFFTANSFFLITGKSQPVSEFEISYGRCSQEGKQSQKNADFVYAGRSLGKDPGDNPETDDTEKSSNDI